MIEEVVHGASIGVQKLEQPDELGDTYRLVVIDAVTDEQGRPIDGSGSMKVWSFYFDDKVRAALHKSTHEFLITRPSLVVPT